MSWNEVGFLAAGFGFGVAVCSFVVDWAHARGRGFPVDECRTNVTTEEQG